MINNEVLDYYNLGAEIGRLERGIGRIELARTKEIIFRYLPNDKATIYDIGGGIGVYSRWLASLGHNVHLIDISPNSIEYAKDLNKNIENKISSLEVGDARYLFQDNNSTDIVLLMGPMYHLTEKSDRIKALTEAYRVLKPNGLFICAGITRYGNLLWSLSVYGQNNKILDESEFRTMIYKEITEGQHIRPEKYPYFIARSYFHLPNEFENEIKEAGFKIEKTLAVEGPTWLVPMLDDSWNKEASQKTILDTARIVEDDKNIIAMSPHFLTIATK